MDSEDAMAKVKEVSEGVRETARTVRQSLEQGQAPGQALGFLRDVVREAPLPSLLSLSCLAALSPAASRKCHGRSQSHRAGATILPREASR